MLYRIWIVCGSPREMWGSAVCLDCLCWCMFWVHSALVSCLGIGASSRLGSYNSGRLTRLASVYTMTAYIYIYIYIYNTYYIPENSSDIIVSFEHSGQLFPSENWVVQYLHSRTFSLQMSSESLNPLEENSHCYLWSQAVSFEFPRYASKPGSSFWNVQIFI